MVPITLPYWGKSRLVEWIGERAHELGAVTVLKVTHSDIPGPSDGLAAMVRRALGTAGLDRVEAADRIAGLLARDGVEEPDEVSALTELVAPRTDLERAAGSPGVTFASARERHVLVRRVLEREAAVLPLILFLDDVQWGHDALEFAAHLLDRQRVEPSPILVMATLRNDALVPGSATSGLVERTLRHPRAERMDISPLSTDDGEELVERLLHLSGPLATEVADRAAGNPLFAVHLVGDWVQRGVLSPGRAGFELADGEDPRVPDDIHAVWMGPLNAVLADPDTDDDRAALELAAALGHSVDNHEWSSACHVGGVSPRRDLVFDLLDAGLVRGSELRWSFAHGLLRESVVRGAREAERWKSANLFCARMLKAAGAGAVRIASHLLAAGEEGSVDLLLEGALAEAKAGALTLALRALEQRERALRRAQLPDADPRWGWGWLATADIHRQLGRLDECERVTDQTLSAAQEHGWPTELQVRTLCARAASLWEHGRARQAVELAEKAESLASEGGDVASVAFARLVLARCLSAIGDGAYAEALVRTARAEFTELDRPDEIAECDSALFKLLKHSGRLEEAADLLRRMTAAHEREGRRKEYASYLKSLGDLERLKGNLRKAESCYRSAQLIFTSIGSRESLVVDFRLGLVLLGRRRYPEARDRIRKGLREVESQGRRRVAPGYHVALAACAATERDWRGYDRHLGSARELHDSFGLVHPDVATTARLAGDLAFARRRITRAIEAWEFALEQWRTMTRADEALALEQLLAEHKA